MLLSRSLVLALAATTLLAGCARDFEIDPSGGVTVTRTACPAVGVPAHTGDVTLFDPPASRDARAIDVVATITNLQTVCNEQGAEIVSTTSFDVLARRTNTQGAREVVLPYFVTVLQGGTAVVSKRVSRVSLRFEDGQARASAQGQGSAVVNRAAATLPEDVRRQITRRRRAGDADAAIDPLSDPAIRAAVQRATFEVLIGFQLTPEQLQYNATR